MDREREIALAENRVQKMELAYGKDSLEAKSAAEQVKLLKEKQAEEEGATPLDETAEVITEETAPKPEPDPAQKKDAADAGGGKVFLPDDGASALSVSTPTASTEFIEGGGSSEQKIENIEGGDTVSTTPTSSAPEELRQDSSEATGVSKPTPPEIVATETTEGAVTSAKPREAAPETRHVESTKA